MTRGRKRVPFHAVSKHTSTPHQPALLGRAPLGRAGLWLRLAFNPATGQVGQAHLRDSRFHHTHGKDSVDPAWFCRLDTTGHGDGQDATALRPLSERPQWTTRAARPVNFLFCLVHQEARFQELPRASAGDSHLG